MDTMNLAELEVRRLESELSELFELFDPSDLYSVHRALYEPVQVGAFELAFLEIREAEEYFQEALSGFPADLPAVRGLQERFTQTAESLRAALSRRLREIVGGCHD